MTPTDGLREHHTRFVYPFVVPALARSACIEALQGDVLVGVASAWERPPAPELYRDELLPHVADYLFPASSSPDACEYLRVAADPVSRLCKGLCAATRVGAPARPVSLSRKVAIEVFLSPFGAGALSISVDASRPDLAIAD